MFFISVYYFDDAGAQRVKQYKSISLTEAYKFGEARMNEKRTYMVVILTATHVFNITKWQIVHIFS